MTQLLSQLIQFYNDDPADPFNIYGLALEYRKFDLEKAEYYFQELLKNHPEYIATYYHAAAFFIDLSKYNLAQATYLKGIEIAENLNKNHALSELKRAHRAFLDEEFE